MVSARFCEIYFTLQVLLYTFKDEDLLCILLFPELKGTRLVKDHLTAEDG